MNNSFKLVSDQDHTTVYNSTVVMSSSTSSSSSIDLTGISNTTNIASTTCPRNVMMSERFQKKSKKLLNLAKKNERLKSLTKACNYYAQSLDVLATAVNYGIAFQESEVRDVIRTDVKTIQRLLSELCIHADEENEYSEDGDQETRPTEQHLLANLDYTKIQNPLFRDSENEGVNI